MPEGGSNNIWSKREVLTLLEAIVQGETNLLVHGRPLHTEWEDNTLNFLADFIFSFRDVEFRDDELRSKIQLARRSIKEGYSDNMDQLVDLLGGFSPHFKSLIVL